MKKKVFALLLTLAMILQCMPIVFAEPASRPSDNVQVGITMEVKEKGKSPSEYSGYLEKSKSSVYVDYIAVMDVQDVCDAFNEWYAYGESRIAKIAGEDTGLYDSLMTAFRDADINGMFTIDIDYPSGVKVPESLRRNTDMEEFNDAAKVIFHEVTREVTSNHVTVTIACNDEDDEKAPLHVGDMRDNLDRYFSEDFTFEVQGVNLSTGSTKTFNVEGELTGTTEFAPQLGVLPSGLISYQGDDAVAVKLIVSGGGSTGGGGTSFRPSSTSKDVVTFVVEGDNIYGVIPKGSEVQGKDLPKLVDPGRVFDAWYKDQPMTEKIEEDETIDAKSSDVAIYGRWINTVLNSDDHFAYIKGYPDGSVRPENNISREEVATIFYRLLKDEVRDYFKTTENTFPDVELGRWSNKAISSMENGAYIEGYEDGYFRPEAYITRAEFATMATRFAELHAVADNKFTDISGHWAEEYILKATAAGWIAGYEDGSFKPDQYITRTEVMTIINRILGRAVDANGLVDGIKQFNDLEESYWAYYTVVEATNSHDFTRAEGVLLENWTALTPDKDFDED